MQYSYKKSEILKFCQNQVLAKSSSFENRVIKECYGHIVQWIFKIWILFPHMRFEFCISTLKSKFSVSSTLGYLLTLSKIFRLYFATLLIAMRLDEVDEEYYLALSRV